MFEGLFVFWFIDLFWTEVSGGTVFQNIPPAFYEGSVNRQTSPQR